ncbi:hypothetical protein D9M68_430510 [compost metagenome]|uniref:hypothetical protein n=1 Tax=Metapseudomonas lalkuanensis TaxID=2604832 RepID=UPI0015B50358|nr:hypothetical protein [Pseudomonas lalkuanensis]
MVIVKHLLLPLLVLYCVLEFELARASSDLVHDSLHSPNLNLSLPVYVKAR